MSSLTSIPPLQPADSSDNPEHYEFLNGRWEKKASVGRKDHSKMGRVMYKLLLPIAEQLGCLLEMEWTVIDENRKLIPDVTLSYPSPRCRVVDGYLEAPALQVVESRSKEQTMQSLIDKCVQDHHAMGTAYCWIIDIEKEAGYECHKGAVDAEQVFVLTAGPSISLEVARVFEAFRAGV